MHNYKLMEEDIKQIIDIMLGQVKKRLEEQEMMVDFDDSVKEYIAKKGVDTNYGARPLKRTIQSSLEDKIAELILDGKIVPKKKVTVTVENDEVKIG